MSTGNPTLMDFARRMDPNDKIAAIIELCNQTNEILEDMTIIEGNLSTGHKTTVRTGLPSSTWRKLNYGVARSKSQTAQVTDSCGMCEQYARVDADLAELNGNTAAFRLSEDKAHIEGMNQDVSQAIFYGDTTEDSEKFVGLTPRFDDVSAGSGANIINGGGSGAVNTSIWLVVWSPNTCHGIFPKGKKAGLNMTDKGKLTVQDTAGNDYEAYVTHYKWDIGLTVRDWQYVVRIANIDVANLKSGTGAADLMKQMIIASEMIPNLGMGRPAFYCSKTIRTYLRLQTLAKTNVNLAFESVAGKRVLTFDDIPVRRCDKLLETEAAVTFPS